MALKKLESAIYTAETTLGKLLREWIKQNGFKSDEAAAKALQRAGVYGSVMSLPAWLRDEPTKGLLSSHFAEFCKTTGIDLDRWMVIEAKQRALAEHPELAGDIRFDTMTTRSEIVAELSQWAELYGGKHHLALQLRVNPKAMDLWINGRNKPDLENLTSIIVGMARGLIMADCQEDVVFILMVRAIFGRDPIEVFEGLAKNSFAACLDLMHVPYRDWTPSKIASVTDIHIGAIKRLKKWRPVSGRGSQPVSSIEKIVRVLVKQRWPALVADFETRCQEYRKREKKGIWEVEEPLGPMIDAIKAEGGSSDVPPAGRTAAAGPARRQRPARPETPDTPAPPVALTERQPEPAAEQPRDLSEALVAWLRYTAGLIEGIPKPQTETAAARTIPRESQTPAPQTVAANDAELIGETIEGVQHCLTQASLKPRLGARLDPETIEKVRTAIEGLRKALTLLCGYDLDYVRSELRTVLGPELSELFLSTMGFEHILETDSAWEVIEGTREVMRDLNIKRRNR